MEKLFEELIATQLSRMQRVARKMRPNITDDDLLQPNDYPELENDTLFRYEEGVMEGLRTALAAIRAQSATS